jgi:hypothetical protein
LIAAEIAIPIPVVKQAGPGTAEKELSVNRSEECTGYLHFEIADAITFC